MENTETLDKIYLEWSQFTKAKTNRELRLENALEWALRECNESSHPHYPYEDQSGNWCYPYLVLGTPMGGGVGEASFHTALEAVEGAMMGKVTA